MTSYGGTNMFRTIKATISRQRLIEHKYKPDSLEIINTQEMDEKSKKIFYEPAIVLLNLIQQELI